MDQYHKNAQVTAERTEDSSGTEVQQLSGRTYDPSSDKQDMRRLGKSQELKVRRTEWRPAI